MSRLICAVMLLPLTLAAKPPAKSAALVDAETRLLRGNYDEAAKAFADLAKAEPVAAARGLARLDVAQGDPAAACQRLGELLKAHPKSPAALADRADYLRRRGDVDAAAADVKAALALDPDQLSARLTHALLAQDRGDPTEADARFRWLVRYYTARSNADADITDAAELVAVATAGAENARVNGLTAQYRFILNEVIADALKSDPNYWPAEVLAGDMLLEKYNRPRAVEAYDKALAINPKCVPAYTGKARAAMTQLETKDAANFVAKALALNPRDPAALRLRGDLALLADDSAAAAVAFAAAAAQNPRDPVTLARRAALSLLGGRRAEFDATVKLAEGYDAKPARFYAELASTLEDRKRYAEAAGYYRKSADLDPTLAAPRAALGLLSLRLGDEAEGKKLLDAALKADPFNVRVANSLKVLKRLDGYGTLTTPHYTIRFDADKDQLLAEFVADYLEVIHADLKKQFAYEPPERVLVEIFDSHDMFSGRTVALPDLHTVGACTGKVFAMASPAAKGVRKPFNWGRVVRHELTHIFNLIETDFKCPHWLTEGLATRNEKMARPPAWTATLRDRFRAGTLFTLDTVANGFIKPKSSDEWGLAYCQSVLYVEYAAKTYGEGVFAKLLTAYKRGDGNAAAVQAACGVSMAKFEQGYRGYVAETLQPYLLNAPKVVKPRTFDELQARYNENPDDLDDAAALAEQLLRRDQAAEAREIAEQVLAKRPDDPTATEVKAKLLVRGGDPLAAAKLLEAARKAHPRDAQVLQALARVYADADDNDRAAEVLEAGRKLAPLDGDWLKQLAAVYGKTKLDAPDKLLNVLRESVLTDPDELAGRIEIARVSAAAGDHATAETFAREALRIDVNSKPAQELLVAALRALKRDAEADKLAARFAAAGGKK